MPIYAWKGLDTTGRMARGTVFARSLEDLEKYLFKNNIGLVQARIPVFAGTISGQEKYTFFIHMSSLLTAHIPVHKALSIGAATAKKKMRMIITDCAALIQEGMPLSEALKVHGIADDLAYVMICIAEKTGDLASALSQLADHMIFMMSFKNKIRALLAGPLITFCVFLAVMIGVFIGVIPRFEGYFSSYGAELPWMTRSILTISLFLRSFSMAYALLEVPLAIGIIYLALKDVQAKDKFVRALPIIGPFYCMLYRAQFFTCLAFLLKNHLALGQALHIAAHAHENTAVSKEIEAINAAIESGQPLSEAINKSLFTCQEVEAFLVIGESSGLLDDMVQHSAQLCQEKVYKTINRWAMLVQPMVLILLGSLIAWLIFAIYMPLLTLSSIIT